MGRDKKWASNDKMKLLVENFKKFMEKGDFSADEGVVDEGVFGKMKGALTGQDTRREKIAKQMFSKFTAALGDSDGDLEKAYNTLTNKYQDVLKQLDLESAKDLFDYAPKGWVKRAITSQQNRALGHNPDADEYSAKKAAQAEEEAAAKSRRMSDKERQREMAFRKAQAADPTYMGK
jgi:hypothetical protein